MYEALQKTLRRRHILALGIALSLNACALLGDQSSDKDASAPDGGSPADRPATTDTPSISDAPTPGGPIVVTGMAAGVIPNGGTFSPVVLNGVPPYSNGVASVTIENRSASPVMIDSIALEPVAPTEPYEWAFTGAGAITRQAFTFSPQMLAPRTTVSVGLHFIPLVSGDRNVRFVVRYGGGQTYSITVAGRGRDNLTFSSHVTNALERLVARSNAGGSNSMQPGTVVADRAGNVYFNVNANQWSDRFNLNVVLVRVNADGRLGWVRELNEPFTQDAIDIGNNGEVGGNPNSLSIDSAGGLYYAFERSSESHNTLFQAAVMKVDSATGNIVWAKGLNESTMAVPSLVRQGMVADGVDATLPDRVILAGRWFSHLFIAALSKTDGTLLWTRFIGLGGEPLRVGAVVAAADGTAYVGGIAANAPFVMRVNGVAGMTPSVAWARSFGLTFANTRGLAIEGTCLVQCAWAAREPVAIASRPFASGA